MADESHSFTTARARLEDIVAQVRKKDTSLEKSLDLLEEGVRLANTCTELIDHADWAAGDVASDVVADGDASQEEPVQGDAALDQQAGGEVTRGALNPHDAEQVAEPVDVGEDAAIESQSEDDPSSDER